ncbi:SWIM zinc finger family protein [Neobacillus notoginsengisoli]|nr:SWIM zinc finger family protein [Neobacillus notoginsengisoli]
MRNEGLAMAAERLGDMLSPHSEEDARLMQRGMLLYRQGMVSQLLIDEETVTAAVQDVVPVRVRLELLFLEMSECTCPAAGICRHQLAVFFAAYGREGSVAEWIEDWRYPMREKKAAADWGLKRARDLVKAKEKVELDYRLWIKSFSESFHSIMRSKKYVNPYVVGELFEVYWRRLRADSPADENGRLLYELAGIVFSIKELAFLSEELGHTKEMVSRYYLHVFSELEEAGIRIGSRLGARALPLGLESFLADLREDVRKLLTGGVPGVFNERMYLYMGLWTVLFKSGPLLEEELGKIETAAPDADGESRHALELAKVHLNFMLRNDSEAICVLSGIENEIAGQFLLFWIDRLADMKEWSRLGPYIDQLAHKLKDTIASVAGYQGRSRFVKAVLETALPFAEATGRMEVFERLLQQALPYSYYDYGNLLFERGDYEKWADLQTFMGHQYTDLPSARLKVLEKELPETVMAMLHQSAARLIAMRNRPSYRSAARLLKKLRTLYKKQKRLVEWEAFFEALLERTKRLRAFHEECQRSKLIDG